MQQEQYTFAEQPPVDLYGQVKQLLYTWFVRYNPLYFFSALCILFGMLLVSTGLKFMDWTNGQLWLSVVIQTYQWLLIAGAALLFRKAAQYRPAVILGIIAIVLLFDCTFRTEVATTLDHDGRTLALVWGLMTLLKLFALSWAFRIKLWPALLVVPVLMTVGLATVPQLIQEHDAMKSTIHLLATWGGVGLTAFVYWRRPEIMCRVSLDDWGQTVLRRLSSAVWIIWLGFYCFHLFIWTRIFDIPLTISHLLSLLLLIPLLSAHEGWIWAGSVNALALGLFNPSTVSVTALAVALILGWQAWRTRQKRLYLGMVLAGYLSIWTIGWHHFPLPDLNIWLSLVTAAILLLMAWRLRLPVALLPLLGGLYPIIKGFGSLDELGWGIFLLAIGFLALVAGVAINWALRGGNRGIET